MKLPADASKGENILTVEVRRAVSMEALRWFKAPEGRTKPFWVPMNIFSPSPAGAGEGVAPNLARPKGLQVWTENVNLDGSRFSTTATREKACGRCGSPPRETVPLRATGHRFRQAAQGREGDGRRLQSRQGCRRNSSFPRDRLVRLAGCLVLRTPHLV